jgi:hypothetical protein
MGPPQPEDQREAEGERPELGGVLADERFDSLRGRRFGDRLDRRQDEQRDRDGGDRVGERDEALRAGLR